MLHSSSFRTGRPSFTGRCSATAASSSRMPTSRVSMRGSLSVSGSSSRAGYSTLPSRPIANQLVEVWQANAAGRYAHDKDQHPAPLDVNFTGAGRCLTDEFGHYRFTTIKPGAYPWLNHPNAWRPAHIHFSVFGRAFTERLITQMYFPGDPLLAVDPIYQSVRDSEARPEARGRPGFRHNCGAMGAGLPFRHRGRRSSRYSHGVLSDGRPEPVPDHRTVLSLRPRLDGRVVARLTRTTRRRS